MVKIMKQTLKAVDILNAYNSSAEFRIYLCVDNKYEDKGIVLKYKGKKRAGWTNYLWLCKKDKRWNGFEDKPCDIINDRFDYWCLDLLDRKFNIYSVDTIKQFMFRSFDIIDDKVIFYYILNNNEVDKYYDDYDELYDLIYDYKGE